MRELFARVAPRYDLVNTLMSFGRHSAWKREAVRLAGLGTGDAVLDVCCGTGDLLIEAQRAVGEDGAAAGVDICRPMFEIALRRDPGLRGRLFLARADALPFRSGAFSAALMGFSLRNVSDVRVAVVEMARVVRPGGKVVLLETSAPDSLLARPFWRLHLAWIVPVMAWLCGAPADAYGYFQRSVREFRSKETLAEDMNWAGLTNVTWKSLALGAVCIHVGDKPL